jgi:hypothetical protein
VYDPPLPPVYGIIIPAENVSTPDVRVPMLTEPAQFKVVIVPWPNAGKLRNRATIIGEILIFILKNN